MPTPSEVLCQAPELEPFDCPSPRRLPHKHHEDYIDMKNWRMYCRACGAESYVPGHEPVEDHPVKRNLPTFEELYEVIGGCVVVSRE